MTPGRGVIDQARKAALTAMFAAGVVLTSALAFAQEPVPAEKPGLFGTVSDWFVSTFKGAGKHVGDFSGATYDTAKGAADVVTSIPGTRVVSGHEVCPVADNGAPDCVIAALTICKAKGFSSGKSLNMVSAQKCPVEAYLARDIKDSACHTETFVSRALCQ